MTLNLDKFTQKTQEALLEASRSAEAFDHTAVEPLHILHALLKQTDGVVPAIVSQIAGSPEMLLQEVDAQIRGFSQVRGSSTQRVIAA